MIKDRAQQQSRPESELVSSADGGATSNSVWPRNSVHHLEARVFESLAMWQKSRNFTRRKKTLFQKIFFILRFQKAILNKTRDGQMLWISTRQSLLCGATQERLADLNFCSSQLLVSCHPQFNRQASRSGSHQMV